MKDNTKGNTRVIRLLVGADVCAASLVPIADEFVPEISEARSRLGLMRASDVLDAVININKSGLTLALDVRTKAPFIQINDRSRASDTRRDIRR